jgi:hypothetical protein
VKKSAKRHSRGAKAPEPLRHDQALQEARGSIRLCSPAGSSQLGQLATVSRVDVPASSVFFCEYVEDDSHQDAADGVNGVVSVEISAHQSCEGRWHYCRVTKRNLVLNDHVRHAMKFWALTHGQVIAAMIREDRCALVRRVGARPPDRAQCSRRSASFSLPFQPPHQSSRRGHGWRT